jgi:hypothetical protein|tara:strand:- start:1569 stop:1673 length:105 start_codon:yes stop_codon:yes gene_type:complete
MVDIGDEGIDLIAEIKEGKIWSIRLCSQLEGFEK